MGALDGEIAIVTGAARGIGRAIAERYAAEGARVALFDFDGEAAADVAAAIGPAATGVAVDVGDEASVGAAVAQAAERLGAPTVLVNNAAATTPRAKITELPVAEWDKALRVNVTGAFLMSRAVLPLMCRGGRGVIINVASQLGQVAVPQTAAYCTTKGAILQLTRALALDHAADGVRVNALSPGAVLTDRLLTIYGSAEAANAALAGKHPIGRIGVPEEIAGAAVFLAGRDARFMTGADLVVDGGYLAQ